MADNMCSEDKMFNLIMCILLIVLMTVSVYADERDCPQSIPTLNVVDRCPEDRPEWIKERKRKQCHQIQQNCTNMENFEYHCLPNSVLDSLFEVCAPKKLIVGKYCPFYDVQQHTVGPNYNQPCGEHEISCPAVYFSKEVYKYQECFLEVTKPSIASRESQEVHIKTDSETKNPAFLVGIYLIFASLAAVLGLFAFRVHLLLPSGGGVDEENTQGKSQETEPMNSPTDDFTTS